MGSLHPVRIDLHVHTARYSQCAESLDPACLPEMAARAGLYGVVITDHDAMWRRAELREVRSGAAGIRIFGGIECSALGCHLVIIGLRELGPVRKGAALEEVALFARSRGAAVILAHPYRDASPESLRLDLVDAIEVSSTSFSEGDSLRSRELALRWNKPMVASSDAHAPSLVGSSWTEFPFPPGDERELAGMIRAGLGRPVRRADGACAGRATAGHTGSGLRRGNLR